MAHDFRSRAHLRRPERSGGGPGNRQRGFTLLEALLVLAIVGLMVAFAIPNMARARARAILLSQVKQVRQAVMVTRMDAIRGGRQSVLGFTTQVGRPALMAWRDDNGNGVPDAGEAVVGRWTFSERVTVANDPALSLRLITGSGTARGVTFLANGTALSSSSQTTAGSGAFLVTDTLGNRFQVRVQGGSGTVSEMMWDGSGWSPRFVHWRY